MSDYAPGTRLMPLLVNITFDADLRVAHCGIGYHLLLPSGRKVDGAYTWHSPVGGYAFGPEDETGQLQQCMDALLRAAAEHEGVELGSGDPMASAAART